LAKREEESTAGGVAAKLAAGKMRLRGETMGRRTAGLGTAMAIAAIVPLLAGCDTAAALLGPYQAHVMGGNADGVVIQYYGDVATTLPLARSHCAQFEKVPDRISDVDGKVTYACRVPGAAPGVEHGDLNSKLTLISDLLPAGAL
jgi:hypothetical protein